MNRFTVEMDQNYAKLDQSEVSETVEDLKELARENARRIAAEFAEKGDAKGWFDALYNEAEGKIEHIPWADLEPNRFFMQWAEGVGLRGEGRKAIVVGCGLGDDARYLYDHGFKVTAFDISPTAIEWARKLHADTDIQFETADLFDPPASWFEKKNPSATESGSDRSGAFDFVLEIYTIQPLPLEMRPQVIDSIAAFVATGGELVAVGRLREDDADVDEVPWPVSRKDLSRFRENGLKEVEFVEIPGDEDDPMSRFVVRYVKA
ncbi:MAG TPA: class I SAM-dependent methyltransferase [Pyrinomonadaceae bacterium]|nr:class I SAM-dependent methyltransferase [Pyrinomonadaceae bacterium]